MTHAPFFDAISDYDPAGKYTGEQLWSEGRNEKVEATRFRFRAKGASSQGHVTCTV